MIAMMEYDKGSAKRIQHFLKVYEFAKLIGQLEELDDDLQFVLETAALVHDIGIRNALEKYGTSAGPYQEKEGVVEAELLLKKLGFSPEIIARVVYLVGHHHTFTDIVGVDYQILVEADFLVNLYEHDHSYKNREHTYATMFKTQGGKKLFRLQFPEDME